MLTRNPRAQTRREHHQWAELMLPEALSTLGLGMGDTGKSPGGSGEAAQTLQGGQFHEC